VADYDVAMYDHRVAKLPEAVEEHIAGAWARRNVRGGDIRGGHGVRRAEADADGDAWGGE